jgi:hypothetical protein
MKPESYEKGTEIDPRSAAIADSSAEMKFARFEPGDLRDSQAVAEALAHWDELDPAALRALTDDPHSRSRLRMLQSVDGWMRRSAHRADAREEARESASACPASEELYDFGRGPGFRTLALERRDRIERHVVSCVDCAGLVASLATTPPLPLDLGPGIEPVIDHAVTEHSNEPRTVSGGPTAAPTAAPGRRPELIAPRRPVLAKKPTSLDEMWKRWAPLAAAAGVLVIGGIWFGSRRESVSLAFPSDALLRGEAGGPLFFPRDRVLIANPKLAAAWPTLAGGLAFEIDPQAGAESYRVDLLRHDGGAFAAATPVLSVTSETPVLSLSGPSLVPGHYTWRAWALERGLERSLGERDFALVEDAALTRELESLADRAEPERSLAAVRVCNERGFLTDARRLAQAMPNTPERDAFLGRMPGR